MDLQARKLEFIEAYIRLADEKIILKLEKLLWLEKEKAVKSGLKKLSQIELDKMLEDSENEIQEGDILSHQLVKQEILTWKTSGK